ncbi:hemolysin family protein [uncultured Robinsoniella sp.]|uniref:hemolysin family protein n=1 Tax=uncultured Robinsoniella sp. TaxID=904190 RepID=UPI00374F9926
MDLDPDPGATQIALQLLFLVFLTFVNAFFAGAEMAVVSVNKNKIRRLADNGNKKAVLIQKLLEDSTKFLSTIQVVITFANFFSSASAASGISKILGGWMSKFNIPFSETIALVIVTVLLSFVTLVLGELVPKRIALQKSEAFSLWTVKPIYIISKVMAPFIKLLSLSTNFLLRLVGMKTENIEERVSEEEIKALLESGSEQGVFNEIEKEMITSIFSFDDKIAKDVMVPRKAVYAIDIEEPLEDYVDELLSSRHSKIPVYKEDIDNIIGVLHMKDFILAAKENTFTGVKIEEIMQEPYFVPESKNTDELFRDLQTKKNHMAILIDEYGGFSGIVTVEDLVEEVMGEINNGYEEEEPDFVQVDEKTYVVDGQMLVDDLNDKLHLKLETENYDTMSGYMVEHLGFIPKDGTHPELKVDGVVLRVDRMEQKAIKKLKITFE